MLTIRDKLPFLILVLNPLEITHVRGQGKKRTRVTEQAMKINEIKTQGK